MKYVTRLPRGFIIMYVLLAFGVGWCATLTSNPTSDPELEWMYFITDNYVAILTLLATNLMALGIILERSNIHKCKGCRCAA